MTGRHRKKIIGKKGKIFWDEGANKNLIKPTQEIGFKVVCLPRSYTNIKFSDVGVAKLAKGKPMVTDDFTAYKNKGVSTGATAYIEPAPVSKQDFPSYVITWKKFLKGHTSKTLAGYRWRVPLQGEVKKEILEE